MMLKISDIKKISKAMGQTRNKVGWASIWYQ